MKVKNEEERIQRNKSLMTEAQHEFAEKKNKFNKRILQITQEVDKDFRLDNCDKNVENIKNALEGIKDLTQIKGCLRAAELMKDAVDEPNSSKGKFRQTLSNKTRQVSKELEAINLDLTPAKTESQDLEKYRICYEAMMKMTNLVSKFEEDAMKIKKNLDLIDSGQKRRIEYVQKIEIALIDTIIPEMKRRRVWDRMSDNYMAIYQRWNLKEQDLRKSFLAMFNFQEIPVIFGELLDNRNSLACEEFFDKNADIQQINQSWDELLKKADSYYSDWKVEYKEMAKQNSYSTLRKEGEELKAKAKNLEKELEQSKAIYCEKQNELESLRKQVEDSISKARTANNQFDTEKAQKEDLVREVTRLNSLNEAELELHHLIEGGEEELGGQFGNKQVYA